MRLLTRKILSSTLAVSIATSPLAPAIGAQPKQQTLPELGSEQARQATTPSAEPSPANQWLERAETDSRLVANAAPTRSAGTDPAMAQGAGLLSGAASEAAQSWFSSQGITSKLNLNTDGSRFNGASLDMLLPFYKGKHSLVFTQAGIRNAKTYSEEARTTVNLGLGFRHDVNDWLLGANSFYDRDVTGSNDRLGFGLEAWTDFLKLSANGYAPLSSWQASPDMKLHLERPARGWDVRAEGYLPVYPQLGGRLVFEQYYGNEVALFSANDRQKDPRAMTVGLLYNPVPLVGLSVDHRMGQGGLSDTSANLAFTYRLGQPLAKQLSADSVAASHRLDNMRYDLVARNNEIVLDYKSVDFKLQLPTTLSVNAGSTVTFALSGAENFRAFNWQGSAAPFALPYNGSGLATLVVPPYNASGTQPYGLQRTGSNTYALQIAGTDRNGRTVVSNPMSIIVQAAASLSLSASPTAVVADGTSRSTISAVVVDGAGKPLAGATVNWSSNGGSLDQTSSLTDSNGVATVSLTGTTTVSKVTVQASFGGTVGTVDVDFVAGSAAVVSSVQASSPSIVADGTSTSDISAVIQDANGNPVAGADVGWTTTLGTLSASSSVTDANGVASVQLTSATRAGRARVEANAAGAASAATVDFVAGAAAAVASVQAASPSIVADGVSTSDISAVIQDVHGNPVAGTSVNWTTTLGTLSASSSVTDANGVATVQLTSADTVGSAQIEASAGGAASITAVTFVAGGAAAISSVHASSSSIVADGASTSDISAVIEDVHGNPVPGTSVNWTTTLGTLSASSSVTDANGVATVQLTSATSVGSAHIEASAGGTTNATVVDFVAGAAAVVANVQASPASIAADGISTSDISAVIKDAHGNPVPGTSVSWTSTLGTLSASSSVTDANGVATVQLTSSTTSGTAQIEANAGGVTGTTAVSFLGAVAAITDVSVNTPDITADGSSSTVISMVLKDVNDQPVQGGVVNWSTSLGSLDATSSVSDSSGRVTVTLTSSTTAGTATVEGAVAGITASATVKFVAGPAYVANDVEATPLSIVADGVSTMTLSAVAQDSNGNPVEGATVSWSTTNGTLSSTSSVSDANGVVSVVLTSSTNTGWILVRATIGSVSKGRYVEFTPIP